MGWISDFIRWKLHDFDDNYIAIFTHGTGTGKSMAAIKLCQSVDTNFNIDKVIFDPEEFIDYYANDRIKKGEALLFDEASAGLSSREWWSLVSRVIMKIVTIFRNRNTFLALTATYPSILDSAILKHCDMKIEMVKRGIGVPKEIKIKEQFKDKIFYVFPRMKNNGKTVIIDEIRFGLPSKKFIEEYESKKRKWQDEFLPALKQQVKNFKEKEKDNGIFDYERWVNRIITNKDKYISKDIGRKNRIFIDPDLIIGLHGKDGIGSQKAMVIKKLVEKKLGLNDK